MQTTEKIALLRQMMSLHQIDACIVPTSDPHLGEYQPAHWKIVPWLTGFTGSAGVTVVTLSDAGFWTDSRYFIQAEKELQNSGIRLFKSGLPNVPDPYEWIAQKLKENQVVGLDGNLFSIKQTEEISSVLKRKHISLNTSFDPFSEMWKDRPSFPANPLFIYPEKYAGKSVQEKLTGIRASLKGNHATALLLTALDEIAWTFNIRGSDIAYTPVPVVFAYISLDEARIFVAPEKIAGEVSGFLSKENVFVSDYNEMKPFLSNLDKKTKLLIDKNKINNALFQAIPKDVELVFASSPVALLKSIKNNVEIEGTRNAMLKDGVALVRFYRWLERALTNGVSLTEMELAGKLTDFRSLQTGYFSESFASIVAVAEHGAIVHYRPKKETNKQLGSDNFLLIDSGCQYLDGTTDITRTIALSELTPQQKKDFSLVLKGHIAIATSKFPHGTRGAQLDALARISLWKNGLTYLHGTGHGVGHFLSVHEGPQNIRLEENPTALLPGMITSNEPGVYREGQYGIRSENLVLVKESEENVFGKFYEFETLTLFPFDTKSIDFSLLNEEEITWLNQYHQRVYEKLSPFLTKEERDWLMCQCADVPMNEY